MRSDDGDERHTIFSQAFTLVEQAPEADEGVAVPLAIFSSDLSALQALVRYLRDARQMPFSRIAELTGRSEKTVRASYSQSEGRRFEHDEGGLTIPLEAFASRALSPLETIVDYLSRLGFSNIDAARMLRLDPRTTWTVKSRAAKKREVGA